MRESPSFAWYEALSTLTKNWNKGRLEVNREKVKPLWKVKRESRSKGVENKRESLLQEYSCLYRRAKEKYIHIKTKKKWKNEIMLVNTTRNPHLVLANWDKNQNRDTKIIRMLRKIPNDN